MCNCGKVPWQHWHAGLVDISPELFRQAFGFPEGAVITGVYFDPRKIGVITLRLEHQDLPMVPEGATVMSLLPRFKISPETGRVEMVEWSPDLPVGGVVEPDHVQGVE